LLGRVDARCPEIALTLLRNLRGLADDEAGAGALLVVLGVHLAGDITFAGA
jgi:hypothetical protein